MNAIVEVETAEIDAQTDVVVVITMTAVVDELFIPVVSTFAVVVPSIGGASLSAVSPDHTLEGRLALGIAA